MASVGKNLRRLRKAAGLTLAAVARKTGFSLGYIQRLEAGQHDPPVSTLRKLARALGVPVTELLE
jgi:transcriptional regulator with XRE-family HTH domain